MGGGGGGSEERGRERWGRGNEKEMGGGRSTSQFHIITTSRYHSGHLTLTSPTDKPPLSPVVSQTHFAECSGCRSTISCWTCCGAGAKGLEREHRGSNSNSRYVRRCKQEATRSETSDNNLYMYRVFHRLMESCIRTLLSTTSVHLH